MFCLADIRELVSKVLLWIAIAVILIVPIVLGWIIQQILPWWFILGVTLATIIYFFDRFPYQHVWNPYVRELYPHRQYNFERAVMQAVHKLPIIPKSRLFTPHLPVEIWCAILDHAISVPWFFDTACEAKTFNLFIHAQAYKTYDFEYSNSERERTNLRKVCKQWSALLDKRNMRWLGPRNAWKDDGTGLIRVDFELRPQEKVQRTPDQIKTDQPQRFPALTTLAIRRSHQLELLSIQEFIQSFLALGDVDLSGIRSLIFEHQYIIPAKQLLDIHQSFSNLTFLRLEGKVVDGSLRLEKLEILYLNLIPPEFEEWSFPSLLHLALGKNYLENRELVIDAIPAVTERLISLLLPLKHAPIVADQYFWDKLPSLQFLGVASRSFSILDHPPSHHPLMHLCFAESHSVFTLGFETILITALNVDQISLLIRRIPNLKNVTMPTIAEPWRQGYPLEWRRLFAAHKKRGITWLNEHGVPIDARRKEKRIEKWWERYLLIFGHVCSLILFIFTFFPSLTPHSMFGLFILFGPVVVVLVIFCALFIADVRRE